MGKDERRRRHYGDPDPELVMDVPLEPAPHTLYSGVPAEERHSFMPWLNS